MQSKNVYHQLLESFPSLLQQGTPPTHNATEEVFHNIQTDGQPVFSKCRLLSLEKLEGAKAEFAILLKEGIIRPSKRPWTSPIHIVPKDIPESCATQWRFCGVYQKLNQESKSDKYTISYLQEFHWGCAIELYFQRLISRGRTIRSL